jgi:hypothetical protein
VPTAAPVTGDRRAGRSRGKGAASIPHTSGDPGQGTRCIASVLSRRLYITSARRSPGRHHTWCRRCADGISKSPVRCGGGANPAAPTAGICCFLSSPRSWPSRRETARLRAASTSWGVKRSAQRTIASCSPLRTCASSAGPCLRGLDPRGMAEWRRSLLSQLSGPPATVLRATGYEAANNARPALANGSPIR